MFDLIKQLIAYNGQANIDNTVLTICQVLIPMTLLYIVWGTTKVISYIVNFGKQN